MAKSISQLLIVTALCASLTACGDRPWNSPYTADTAANTYFSSFQERPKHLDPVRSYSSDEYEFIGQIYEPPLQYHYFDRPYRLEPLTATTMPQIRYLDADGVVVAEDAPQLAYSVYRIAIQPGIRYQPHPALARGEDGSLMNLALRPAQLAQIHSLADFAATGSRELVADDYVYQLKRMAHPQFHSPIAGVMAEYIVGMPELMAALRSDAGRTPAGKPLSELAHAGVRSVGRYAFEITVKGRYPQLSYWLAMPFFAPIPWEADAFYAQPGLKERNITLDWYPIGTGPYMLTENNPNRRMVLTRNPNYRGTPFPPQPERLMPFIDTAIYSLEQEAVPYWSKFLQGYYDDSRINSDSFDQAIQLSDVGDPSVTPLLQEKGIQLSTATTSSVVYFGFNFLDPVVGGNSKRARLLRQAISIALNYEEYISIFANGRGLVAQSPLPPGIPGYIAGAQGINPVVYTWQGKHAVRRPISQARALLAQAGYADGRDAQSGKPLVLYFDVRASGPDDKARLDWTRKQFAKLGIQLVVRGTSYSRFQEKMRTGQAQMFQWGWNADYPDPENFLFLLYGPNGKVEHGGENAANYQNPEFDALFEQMKNMRDSPERRRIVKQMIAILQHDAPWAWGYHPVKFSLQQAWLHNQVPNLMAHNTLQYWRIDTSLRERSRRAWNQPVLWPLAVLAVGLLAAFGVLILAYRRRESRRV